MVLTRSISADQLITLLRQQEGHFFDFKAKEIKPSKLSKSISAFANASGGEVMVGIEELEGIEGTERRWCGFPEAESANALIQILHDLDPVGSNFSIDFLEAEGQEGLAVHLLISKTQSVVEASDGKTYIRKGAQNLPVNQEGLERLKYDKGIYSYEDELLNIDHKEISNSSTAIEFMLDSVPVADPFEWQTKQRILSGERPTVAGVLLFSDLPQTVLPKRSAVKILRYKTKEDAERDYLAGDPETVEGPIYSLIYDSVARVREIIEGIEKIGAKGMEKVVYPEEALHELVTNAVLHRDYSIP